jgi:outer membrane protein assembly factor BamE (lipoprotein component of BamABCDE complex)
MISARSPPLRGAPCGLEESGMRYSVRWVVLLALGTCVACASVGRKFDFENRTRLALGHTTKAQAIELLGEPRNKASLSNQDGNFEHFQYLYSYGDLGGAAARVLFLEFKAGVLNAYSYASGFEEDSTEFDYDASAKVTAGKSKKQEVLKLLGEPTGKARCPSYQGDYVGKFKGATDIWLWAHTSKSKGLDKESIKSMNVFVSFDVRGVARDITRTKDE